MNKFKYRFDIVENNLCIISSQSGFNFGWVNLEYGFKNYRRYKIESLFLFSDVIRLSPNIIINYKNNNV